MIHVVIGFIVYPAATLKRRIGPAASATSHPWLNSSHLYVHRIDLYKSGVKYEAVALVRRDRAYEKNWVIYGLGNIETIDSALERFNEGEHNALFINGPFVDGSGGWPTSYQIGAGYEARLQWLE